MDFVKSRITIQGQNIRSGSKKALNNGHADLDLIESPITRFLFKETDFVRNFEHQAVTGKIYTSHNTKRRETTINLVWLNPPRQRISIYLTQPEGSDYSPDDLIRLPESMQPAM
jgi:hypothetical protein